MWAGPVDSGSSGSQWRLPSGMTRMETPSASAAQADGPGPAPVATPIDGDGADATGADPDQPLLDVAALHEEAGVVPEVMEADEAGDHVEQAAVVGGDDPDAEVSGAPAPVDLVADERGAEHAEEAGQARQHPLRGQPPPALLPPRGDLAPLPESAVT